METNPAHLSLAELEQTIDEEMDRHPDGSHYASALIDEFERRHSSTSEAKSDVQPPAESVLLNDAYKNSGLTAADLAASTSLSISAVRVALAGIRYRQGEAKVTIPPDQTVAKLASALGVGPQSLSAVGRERAAEDLKLTIKETHIP